MIRKGFICLLFIYFKMLQGLSSQVNLAWTNPTYTYQQCSQFHFGVYFGLSIETKYFSTNQFQCSVSELPLLYIWWFLWKWWYWPFKIRMCTCREEERERKREGRWFWFSNPLQNPTIWVGVFYKSLKKKRDDTILILNFVFLFFYVWLCFFKR